MSPEDMGSVIEPDDIVLMTSVAAEPDDMSSDDIGSVIEPEDMGSEDIAPVVIAPRSWPHWSSAWSSRRRMPSDPEDPQATNARASAPPAAATEIFLSNIS